MKWLESNVFSFLNSFSTSKCFDLFDIIFLLRLDNLASKSVFVIKFACASFALKALAAKVLNFGVEIYFSWSRSVSFFSSSLIFVSQFVFLTRLLTSGILFSTAVNAVLVAKPLTSGILFSNSVNFVSLTKSITWAIFFLILLCLFDSLFSKQIH